MKFYPPPTQGTPAICINGVMAKSVEFFQHKASIFGLWLFLRHWQIITQPKDRWMMIEATIEWHNGGKGAIRLLHKDGSSTHAFMFLVLEWNVEVL